ncbi:MAG: sulfide/dihydroorotate dehydrogenase-like FAD/NAD-binding protein [Bacilli bacterium]|nr:sulfide/dihydroorotate dehydrogenase-like FAD/NAD-binding protein [Bacilli bacterium]
MYKILNRKQLTDTIFSLEIEAPLVSKSAKAGQFVIVINDEKGERIPLTIADMNPEKGSVTIVVQTVGASTLELSKKKEGESIYCFVGPLGQPSELVYSGDVELKEKKIVFIAGGVGAAPVYPQVKELHRRGYKVDVILGARDKSLIIMEEELKEVAEKLYICTDNGSYGFKGNVCDMLKYAIKNDGRSYNQAVAIGPVIMMKFACLLTKELNIPTIVSMNPIMVDGTGMCGACRLVVDEKVKFACVDGPEFDGWKVDFDGAMRRSKIYKTEEGRALLKAKEGDTHDGGCGYCK